MLHKLIHSIIHLFSILILVDNLVLFTIKVNLLDLANLLIEPLDFKFVCVNLRLVVFELTNHLLQLHSSLL